VLDSRTIAFAEPCGRSGNLCSLARVHVRTWRCAGADSWCRSSPMLHGIPWCGNLRYIAAPRGGRQ
jgi:hypothetical protein